MTLIIGGRRDLAYARMQINNAVKKGLSRNYVQEIRARVCFFISGFEKIPVLRNNGTKMGEIRGPYLAKLLKTVNCKKNPGVRTINYFRSYVRKQRIPKVYHWLVERLERDYAALKQWREDQKNEQSQAPE